ncbi:MAG: 50S ribosome-binding GTPase [Syntrophales bacterium]|nr:50S ribosome-binding GTPase [Syntrophales bacterium]
MPANLPPDYFEAERRYKQASTTAEKIAALEDLMATVPKHKGTDHLRADLRRKLSQLNKEAQEQRKKKGGGRDSLYNIPREGAAQVALVGFANSGKSSILATLTKAAPVIADYPLSTVLPCPGMMPYEDIQIQLIDLPPIPNETTDGWVSGIMRVADALLIVIDLAGGGCRGPDGTPPRPDRQVEHPDGEAEGRGDARSHEEGARGGKQEGPARGRRERREAQGTAWRI